MDAVAAGRVLLAREEEELLGLLAGFPDGGSASDRELSFSDFVEAGASRRSVAADDSTPAPREEEGQRGKLSSPWKPPPATKQQQRQREQATAAREKRPRRQRSGGGGGRGSCGGGDDGVLLNLYVPGLLTRSVTAPRLGRGAALPPPRAGPQGAPAKAAQVAAAAAGKKARARASLGIGCWPALWGRGRDRRNRTTTKACT